MVSPDSSAIRFDLRIIAESIEPGSRVLDLGCGNGDLLAWLQVNKKIIGSGIEQDEQKAATCIARGLSVIQGDLNEEVDEYPDHSFDYVILSQTLQQVFEPAKLLKSLARVGKRVIVSFPNFSHIAIRTTLLFTGLAPKNNQLPYNWYDSPNIRVITLKDFKKFARNVGYAIVKETAINTNTDNSSGHVVNFMTNLRANYGVFVIEKKQE